jgi:hypothetical protein
VYTIVDPFCLSASIAYCALRFLSVILKLALIPRQAAGLLRGYRKHLKEVQATKSGFALCPTSSAALADLESQIPAISNFFGPGSFVEKAPNWASYRIFDIPRNIVTIDDNNNITQSIVSPDMLCSALAEATGTPPAAATLTAPSLAYPHNYSTTWIVRLPNGSPPLPRSLLLFGARATTRLLPNKPTIIQCDRCYQWHNKRSCARPARCRLCGSTSNPEAEHPPCGSTPHNCPPCCLHCRGPHPADSIECLLRPKPGRPLTKAQKAEIRQSCSSARLRVCSSTGCLKPIPGNDQMDHSPTTIEPAVARPTTPPPGQPPSIPPATEKAVRFANRFSLPDSIFSSYE